LCLPGEERVRVGGGFCGLSPFALCAQDGAPGLCGGVWGEARPESRAKGGSFLGAGFCGLPPFALWSCGVREFVSVLRMGHPVFIQCLRKGKGPGGARDDRRLGRRWWWGRGYDAGGG
jgi:hypothetical protein